MNDELMRRISDALDSEEGLAGDEVLSRELAQSPDAARYARHLARMNRWLAGWPLEQPDEGRLEALAASVDAKLGQAFSGDFTRAPDFDEDELGDATASLLRAGDERDDASMVELSLSSMTEIPAALAEESSAVSLARMALKKTPKGAVTEVHAAKRDPRSADHEHPPPVPGEPAHPTHAAPGSPPSVKDSARIGRPTPHEWAPAPAPKASGAGTDEPHAKKADAPKAAVPRPVAIPRPAGKGLAPAAVKAPVAPQAVAPQAAAPQAVAPQAVAEPAPVRAAAPPPSAPTAAVAEAPKSIEAASAEPPSAEPPSLELEASDVGSAVEIELEPAAPPAPPTAAAKPPAPAPPTARAPVASADVSALDEDLDELPPSLPPPAASPTKKVAPAPAPAPPARGKAPPASEDPGRVSIPTPKLDLGAPKLGLESPKLEVVQGGKTAKSAKSERESRGWMPALLAAAAIAIGVVGAATLYTAGPDATESAPAAATVAPSAAPPSEVASAPAPSAPAAAPILEAEPVPEAEPAAAAVALPSAPMLEPVAPEPARRSGSALGGGLGDEIGGEGRAERGSGAASGAARAMPSDVPAETPGRPAARPRAAASAGPSAEEADDQPRGRTPSSGGAAGGGVASGGVASGGAGGGPRGGGAATAPAPAATARPAPPPPPSAPVGETLDRETVQSVMASVEPAVRACAGERHGTVQVDVVVQGTGRVSSATISGLFAGSAEGSCMARAVRQARFPGFTGEPLRFRYPYGL